MNSDFDEFGVDRSPEEIKLETAVNNALECFQNKEFALALPYITEAIDLCESFGVSIPNLYLMKAFSEMQLGRYSDALNSIEQECVYYPNNARAFDLKFEIESRYEEESKKNKIPRIS
jgi:tetratricopeptide (TPR) repeat protein